jgi:hypothetical protein
MGCHWMAPSPFPASKRDPSKCSTKLVSQNKLDPVDPADEEIRCDSGALALHQ